MSYTFTKPARPVRRVFIHCSASDNPDHDSAAVMDAWHKENGWSGIGYHFFIRKDGVLELGRDLEKTPAAQGGNNTATIAICLHGLDVDKFTEAQFATLRQLCRDIDHAYKGAVTFHGHCEVAAKTCPVFDYRDVIGLTRGGDLVLLGQHNAESIPVQNFGPDPLEVLPIKGKAMKLGDKGGDVRALQTVLTQLGYHTGAIDGDFGKRTRASVMALQADNNLTADGIVGPLTREVLAISPQREIAPARAFAGLTDLAADGSRIAKSSIANGVVGALLGGSGAAAILDQVIGGATSVSGHADQIQNIFAEHGLITGGVILAAGIFVAWQSWRAGKARVEDHRTGKTA